jgi:hypothetical protein
LLYRGVSLFFIIHHLYRDFVSKWYLKKHRKFCHETGKQGEWIDCEYCQKSYLTDCERKKHYANDHSEKIKELWERKWY